jgi:hypothetical protein
MWQYSSTSDDNSGVLAEMTFDKNAVWVEANEL